MEFGGAVPAARASRRDKRALATTSGIKLKLKHAAGVRGPVRNNLECVSFGDVKVMGAETLIFPVGRHVAFWNTHGDDSMKFLPARTKGSREVTAMCISANQRLLVVCDQLQDGPDAGTAHMTIYHTQNKNKIKTMQAPARAPFLSCCFSGDNRFLVTVSDEPERTVTVWDWEAEKVHKSAPIGSGKVSRVACAPGNALHITTTGQNHLRSWAIGSDNHMRSHVLVPAAREQETFVDHSWITVAGSAVSGSARAQRQDVGGPGLPTDDAAGTLVGAAAGGGASGGGGGGGGGSGDGLRMITCTEGEGGGSFRNATVIVFDHIAQPPFLELKQTVQVALPSGTVRLETIKAISKGFVIAGSSGFFAVFEKTEDKKDPYQEIRSIRMSNHNFHSLAVGGSDEALYAYTKAGRLLTFSLSHVDMALDAMGGGADELSGADDASLDSSVAHGAGGDGTLGLHVRRLERDVLPGGMHTKSIVAMDTCTQRPVYVTVSLDCTLRVWNFVQNKCEIVHPFQNDTPTAVALHPHGFQVLVGFDDRVRLYNILMDSLASYRETMLKGCRELRYCHGGHLFASNSSINVIVCCANTMQILHSFQGHMMHVKRLCWMPNDNILVSAGADGSVYGWSLDKRKRLDLFASSSRTATFQGLALHVGTQPTADDEPDNGRGKRGRRGKDGRNGGGGGGGSSSSADGGRAGAGGLTTNRLSSLDEFDDDDTGEEAKHSAGENGVDSDLDDDVSHATAATLGTSHIHHVVVSTNDGQLRSCPWSLEEQVALELEADMMLDHGLQATVLQFIKDGKYLVAGMSNGSLRVYRFPITNASPYNEFVAHSGKVTCLTACRGDTLLLSGSEDGSIMCFSIQELSRDLHELDDVHLDSYNSEIVLVAKVDIQEHAHEMGELKKELEDMRHKHEFELHQKDSLHHEEVKKLSEEKETLLSAEKDRYEHTQNEYERRIRAQQEQLAKRDIDHIHLTSELENRYEHKLADQLDRYDKLNEDMVALRQQCNGVLESQRLDQERELKEREKYYSNMEKALKAEVARLREDRRDDESTFKEVLDQQEGEYEHELKQLIAAADRELQSERSNTMRMQTIVQTKNTKLDRLKKKLQEMKTASQARHALLIHERREKKRLQETIEHYKKNLVEREVALAEKEKAILDLRNTTRTLENFRFVLDHRLQQLMEERAPVTKHIEGLELHIRSMYEELVEEFESKKRAEQDMEQKDLKVSTMSGEVARLRQQVRDKELTIASIRRELTNLVGITVAKDLDEAVKDCYRKFVRGEDGSRRKAKASGASGIARVTESLKEEAYLGSDDDASVDGGAPSPLGGGGAGGGIGGGIGGPGLGGGGGGVGGTGHGSDGDHHHHLGDGGDGGAGGGGGGGGGGGDGHHHTHALGGAGQLVPQGFGARGARTFVIPGGASAVEVAEELTEGVKEAHRQKRFLEKSTSNLQHRLNTAKRDAARVSRARLQENAVLIHECNELRRENSIFRRDMEALNNQYIASQKALQRLRRSRSSLGGNTGALDDVGSDDENGVTTSGDRRLDGSESRGMRSDLPSAGGAGGPSDSMARGASTGQLERRTTNNQGGGPLEIASPSASQSDTSWGVSRGTGIGHDSRKGRGGKSTRPLPYSSSVPTMQEELQQRIMRGSNKVLSAGNDLNHAVVDLTRQLDSATREVQMQKMELAKLREYVRVLLVTHPHPPVAKLPNRLSMSMSSRTLPKASLGNIGDIGGIPAGTAVPVMTWAGSAGLDAGSGLSSAADGEQGDMDRPMDAQQSQSQQVGEDGSGGMGPGRDDGGGGGSGPEA